MSDSELERWIRYHDARFGGFAKWAAGQLGSDEGRELFARGLAGADHAAACAATDRLDESEDRPRGFTEQFRAVRAILRRARARPAAAASSGDGRQRDPICQRANFAQWLGYAARALEAGNALRGAAEYWQMVWDDRAGRIAAQPQRGLAMAWAAEAAAAVECCDSFAGLPPADQDQYLRRAAGLLPHLREDRSGDDALDAQAVALAIYAADQRQENSHARTNRNAS